jgi:hypothetical protein
MSVTIVSFVIAGCEVTGKLHRDVEVRGCEHPTAESNFCAQCGKPMFRTSRRTIPGYDGDDHLVIDGKRWEIVSDARDRRFVGVVLARVSGWTSTVARVEQIADDAFANLRDGLASISLWDPDTYGIWSVLYASS